MNNIEFNDELAVKNSILYSRFEESNKRPTLVNFLMSKGITKSENSSNIVLLIISALFFLFKEAIFAIAVLSKISFAIMNL